MITGGCQCGAVRYSLCVAPMNAHFCHCRMCQRAVGGPFGALGSVPRHAITFTKGEPKFYASSSVARRGFCADCGTPLSFDYPGVDRFNITLGSLDHPENHPILRHYGVESKMPWLKLCDGLPETRTEDFDSDVLKTMTIYQSETE